MKKWIIILFLIVAISFVVAEITPSKPKITASGNAEIPGEWEIIELDKGWELEFKNIKEQSTEICLYNPSAKSVNDIPAYKKVYDSKNSLITNLPAQIITASVEPKYGYCFNNFKYDYLKFGLTSTIIIYQKEKIISYVFDWGSANITLYKEGQIIEDIYVYTKNESGWGFKGRDESLGNNLSNFTYVLNSTEKLIMLERIIPEIIAVNVSMFNGTVCENETTRTNCTPTYINITTYETTGKIKYQFPVFYTYYPNDWNEHRHWFDFEDICSKNYSNCSWNYYDNSAIINFVSNGSIDPSIQNVSECQTLTNNTNGNIYQLNTSITGITETCMVIGNNSIIFDLNDFNMTATSYSANYYGIDNSASWNDTLIENGYVYDFGKGVYSTGYTGNFTNLTIKAEGNFGTAQIAAGIYLSNDNNSITNNNISINNTAPFVQWSYGIYLATSSDNVVENNIANKHNLHGIYLAGYGSDNNQIINNTANSNLNTGINIYYSTNNTIKDNTANSNTNWGIYLVTGTNNTIKNNIVNTNKYGIQLATSSDNNNITDNTVNSNNNHGIYLASSSNNNITSNTANSNSYETIYLASSSDNNEFSNNDIWNCSSGGSYSCIHIYLSDYNTFKDNKINKSSNYGVKIYTDTHEGHSSHNVFKNTNMTNIDGTSVFLDTYASIGENLNNTFLNFSYNNETVDAESELIRKWYYRAYVNDTNGNYVADANVLAYNNQNDLVENLTTNASGWTEIGSLIDYINTGTKTYYSNYSIQAFNQSLGIGNKLYNITANENNLNDFITIENKIYSCINLNAPNIVYTQFTNIINNDLTDDCIIITAQNITFNGNSYYISSDDDESGVYSAQYNTTIKNCNISMGFGPNSYGIELASANNSYIYNNTLSSPYHKYGLWLDNVQYVIIENNTVNSNNNHGIYLASSSNNNITGNTANSNPEYGIYLATSSDNNIIEDNTVNSNGYSGFRLSISSNNQITNNDIWDCSTDDSSYACIRVHRANYNTFNNNKINKSSNYGIWISSSGVGDDSSHNLFKNTNMTNIDGTSVFLDDASGSLNENNTFLNFTYNNETVDANSTLIREWWYRAYTNDTCGDIVSGANITAYNSSDDYQFNLTTGSDGFTPLQEIIDYYNIGGTKTYYSLYNIYASNSSYITINQSYNVTLEKNNYKNVLTFTEPNITAFDGDIDCSCDWDFATNQNIDANISLIGTGTISLLSNWTFTHSSWEIFKEDGCVLYKEDGSEIK